MAEAAGLVLGTIALASLFSTCRGFFETFELGWNQAADYEIAETKLILLRARLIQSCEVIGLQKAHDEHDELHDVGSSQRTAVRDSLLGIKSIFGNAAKLHDKYGLGAVDQRFSRSLSLQTYPGLQEIKRKLELSQRKRRSFISFKKKVVWAVLDKKKFDALISDLDFFITNLEKVSRYMDKVSSKETSVTQKLKTITDPKAVSLLQKAGMAANETNFTETNFTCPAANSTPGSHVHVDNQSSGNATYLKGDVGGPQNSIGHTYMKNHAKENSFMVGGNTSDTALKALLENRITMAATQDNAGARSA